MLILLNEKRKGGEGQMGWGKRLEENLCFLFCAAPHMLHLLPQAHRGRVKAGRWVKGTERFCTWIIPVSNPVPLLLLPSRCANYSSGVLHRLFPRQGPPQHPEHLEDPD